MARDLKANFSLARDDDAHFRRCWAQQTCGGCLNATACSWCPLSWACVPNNYAVPLLAPAFEEDMCPHWAERWEIRTRPLGCQVSTITSLTAIVSVVSTLVLVLVLVLVVNAVVRSVRWLRQLNVRYPGWWRVWETDWPSMRLPWRRKKQRGGAGEEGPLLGR